MGDLSVTTITALAAAGAVLIAAFFAGLVSVITAWQTIANKVTAIEGHVNSEKTAADGREKTLTRENELLREMLNDRKQTAALLAQAASHPKALSDFNAAAAATEAPAKVEVVNTPLLTTSITKKDR